MATKEKRPAMITPEGIGTFVFLHEPRKGQDEDSEPKYTICVVFDKRADLSEFDDAVEEAAIEEFGKTAPQMLERGKLRNPIRDASDWDDQGFPFDMPGARMITFKTKDMPGIVDEDANPIMDRSEIYSGMKCRVSCSLPKPYEAKGNKGLTFYLNNVQKTADGKKLSGKKSAEEEFGALMGKAKGRAKPAARRSSRDAGDDLLG